MRGEQLAWRPVSRPVLGSPPHAGSRSGTATSSVLVRDHPRMRGEQPAVAVEFLPGLGSPPHARGAAPELSPPATIDGITPACAGSRVRAAQATEFFRDHPRMRGEQSNRITQLITSPGSPPHARGAVARSLLRHSKHGITPACAGSSFRCIRPEVRARDHPRMRGEQGVFEPDKKPLQGSPPHARGAGSQKYFRCRLPGITPACAGSSPVCCQHIHHQGDHPRMRGEQLRHSWQPRPRMGSPPHARGAVGVSRSEEVE